MESLIKIGPWKKDQDAPPKQQSIIRKWLFSNMAVIVFVLIAVEIVMVFSIRSYYYNNVRTTMETRMESFFSGLSTTGKGSAKEAEIQQSIKEFSGRDTMLVLALDSQGNAVLTSTGFPPEGDWVTQSDLVKFTGDQSDFQIVEMNGESVMRVARKIPNKNDQYYAVEFAVSLSRVDRQIMYFLFGITLVCLAIIMLVVFSSAYFIRSIVIPVSQVSQAARRIAAGDFTARLNVESSDEIGELCESINYMADELSQAEDTKNEFISSVSHELRTPLTAIRGWAETLTLTNGEDPATMEKGMRVILSETERLGNMVEELLDFSRMESGRFSLILEKMDVLAELEETVLMFAERARREGVELILDTEEYGPPIMGDKNRIKQVFVNILDNALKYTDSGKTITAQARYKDNSVEISIIDTGCGIPSADLPRVKERFYKGHGARRGSGIGLSVVEEIVTRHHGTIDIDSVENEGTTVTMVFPTYAKWEKEGYEAN